MVRRATGFHDDQSHLPVGEPALKLAACQAVRFDHSPRGIGHRELKNGLG